MPPKKKSKVTDSVENIGSDQTESSSQVGEKSRESNWSNAETFDLIRLSTDQEWRAKFTSGRKSHIVIWEDLSKSLLKCCSGTQAKNKWNALIRDYRNIKKNLKSGDPPPRWPFWEEMKRFLEPRPMQSNEHVLESVSRDSDRESPEAQRLEPSDHLEPENPLSDSTSGMSAVDKVQEITPNRFSSNNRKRKRENDFESTLKELLQEHKEDAVENRKLTTQLITLLSSINSSIQSSSSVIIVDSQSSNVNFSNMQQE